MRVLDTKKEFSVRGVNTFFRLRAGMGRGEMPEDPHTARLKAELAKRKRQLARQKHETTQTLPQPDTSLNRVEVCRSILAPLQPGRLLDLGCGHGKFSLLASSMGWEVTGVDARTERMPEDKNIEWVQSDVRMFEIGRYDCILLLGLLYHLPAEDQLSLLRKCSRAAPLTILDTHVAGEDKLHKREGYLGTLYKEPGLATSSWGNETSFWATYPELLRMLRDAGFSHVAPVMPPYTEGRTFYICHC